MAGSTGLNACQRCREQKVRCSRDVPICLRCRKANVNCQYPPPPNRGPNAKQRHAIRRRASSSSHQTANTVPPEDAATTTIAVENWNQSSIPNNNQNSSLPSIGTTLDPIDGLPLPSMLDSLLQNIFFHYIFTSNLMLHRMTFEIVNNQQHQVPYHLRAAMYALASNFLDPPCKMALPLVEELQCLGNTRLWGMRRAEYATKECLQHMDRPEVYDIQTAAILAMYWAARGDQIRNTMFQEMAYRASRMFLQDNSALHEPDGWMMQEIKHRLFWMSWLQTSVNSDQYIVGSSMDVFLTKVPLPSTQTSFLKKIREMRLTFPEIESMAINGENSQFEPNIFAELLRLTIYWSKIRDHVETRFRSMSAATLSESLRLEEWLSNYHQTINKSLRFDLRHTAGEIDEECLLQMHFVQICYNICRLQLHVSLIAQYNKQDSSQDIPREMLKSNALATVESAQSMSRVAEDMLTMNIEPARLSAFMGYSMYVAASIHICFLSLPAGERADRAWHDLIVLLKVIKSMMPYWTHMQGLWYRILRHFDTQVSLHTNEKPQRNITLPPSDTPNDSSTAMRQLRHFGGSLADAVLNYRLGQTEESQPMDYTSPAMVRLEELMSNTQPPTPAVPLNNSIPIINSNNIPNETHPPPDLENLPSYPSLPSELDILASLPPLFFDNDFWQPVESGQGMGYPGPIMDGFI